MKVKGNALDLKDNGNEDKLHTQTAPPQARTFIFLNALDANSCQTQPTIYDLFVIWYQSASREHRMT